MKKILVIVAAVAAFTVVSCTSKTSVEQSDANMTDTTAVDSITVLSAPQDSVVLTETDSLGV